MRAVEMLRGPDHMAIRRTDPVMLLSPLDAWHRVCPAKLSYMSVPASAAYQPEALARASLTLRVGIADSRTITWKLDGGETWHYDWPAIKSQGSSRRGRCDGLTISWRLLGKLEGVQHAVKAFPDKWNTVLCSPVPGRSASDGVAGGR